MKISSLFTEHLERVFQLYVSDKFSKEENESENYIDYSYQLELPNSKLRSKRWIQLTKKPTQKSSWVWLRNSKNSTRTLKEIFADAEIDTSIRTSLIQKKVTFPIFGKLHKP